MTARFLSGEKVPEGCVVLTGDGIKVFRLLSLRGMLSLELKGLHRSHGPSAYVVIKKEFNLKGSRQKVYDAYCTLLREKGILHDQV